MLHYFVSPNLRAYNKQIHTVNGYTSLVCLQGQHARDRHRQSSEGERLPSLPRIGKHENTRKCCNKNTEGVVFMSTFLVIILSALNGLRGATVVAAVVDYTWHVTK